MIYVWYRRMRKDNKCESARTTGAGSFLLAAKTNEIVNSDETTRVSTAQVKFLTKNPPRGMCSYDQILQ